MNRRWLAHMVAAVAVAPSACGGDEGRIPSALGAEDDPSEPMIPDRYYPGPDVGEVGRIADVPVLAHRRDAHVQCIWEGTTSVMAHDVLRALGGGANAETFLAEVEARVHSFQHPTLDEPRRAVAAALERLKTLLAETDKQGGRRLTWGMARTYQAALLCEAAGWALSNKNDPRPAVAAALFSSDGLVGPELPANDDLGALAFDRRA